MGYLNVTGVPKAPSGKTLQVAYLTVILQANYEDHISSYPPMHWGIWTPGDANWRAYEPLPLNSNLAFQIPGKLEGAQAGLETNISAPLVLILEHHIYTDGSEQIWRRYTHINDNGFGDWTYADPDIS